MIERVISLEVQKAHEELRRTLLKNNCRVISEEPLKSIVVEHGYPSNLSARESWKRVSFYLFPEGPKTRIVSSTSLIFRMPVGILTYLMVCFSILFLISFLAPALGSAALVGLIVIIVIFEIYTHLHQRESFSEEVLRILSQKQDPK